MTSRPAILMSLALVAMLSAPLRAQQPKSAAPTPAAPAKAAEEDKLILSAYQVELAKKEIERRAEVRKRQRDYANTRDYVLAVSALLIQGNYNDYEFNRSQLGKAEEKAAELAARGDAKQAEAMKLVADLYRRVALANRAIYLAYTQSSGSIDISEQLAEIKAAEKRFTEITSHTMKRTWLTPEEFEAYQAKLRFLREKQAKEARQPASVQGRQ